MSSATKLTRQVIDELRNERGEVDWIGVRDEVSKRLVIDMDEAKRIAAVQAVESVRRAVTKLLTDQLPLPGVEPDPDAYMPYDENKSVRAVDSVFEHVIAATALRQEDLNKKYAAFAQWQQRMIPLYTYFAKGLNWAKATRQYAADHTEEEEKHGM